MRNVLGFLKNPENLALASWVQTFSVVLGIVIALFQLSSVLRDQDYKKGAAYLKFESEYASGISRDMGLVYEYQNNSKMLSIGEYHELYPRDKYIDSLRSIENYIARLSACGALGVCPSEVVDGVVCSLSKEMYLNQSRNISWPPEWKIKFSEPVFYEVKISEHCSLFDRVVYFFNR